MLFRSKAPKGLKKAQGKANLKDYFFTMQVDPADCTGCANCADVCPAKEKALVMKPAESQLGEQANFEYLHNKVGYKDNVAPKGANPKNSQFAQPLFEFSGACAGCGETPYIKLITQMFGDRIMIAITGFLLNKPLSPIRTAELAVSLICTLPNSSAFPVFL